MGNFITIETTPCPVDTIIDAKMNEDEADNSSKVQEIIKGIEKKNKKMKKNGK
jgi:predicted solute-binding protein